jgi:hypothetical protein
MAILQQHGFGVQFGVLWEGLELSLALTIDLCL